MAKQYKIIKTRHYGWPGHGHKSESDVGTVEDLIQYYFYTLECGAAYEHEKGNKKINCSPKTIKSLVTNLNNAVNNSATNGYAGIFFDYVEA